MPRGTRHTLTGTLRRTQLGYVLEIEGGGVWRLDLGTIWRIKRYMDRKIIVEGIRSGFDLLDVNTLKAVGNDS